MKAIHLSGVALLALTAQPALGQTAPAAAAAAAPAPPSPSEPAQDDIVVTAQKRSERLQDVPLAVTAIGGDTLATRGSGDLASVQALVPNVNISQRQSSGVVTVRGIGFDIITAGADSSVAVHIDGVYVSRPAAALAGLYDIERIEVARGPQGTLYGRNATGGAINIISRRPTEEPSGYVNASFGNYSALTVEGALSGAIVPGKIRARIAFKSDDHSGYGTNLLTGKDIDDLNSRAARASIEFLPTDNFTLLVVGDYFREKDSAFATHYAGPIIPGCVAACGVSNGGLVAPDIRDVNQDAATTNEREFYGVNASASLDLGAAQLTSITGYRKGTNDYQGDLDGTSAFGASYTRNEDQRQFSQELQLGGKTGGLTWLLGGYYFNEHNFARGTALFNPATTAGGRSTFFQGGTLITDAYAVFGQASYELVPGLSLTLGGRYSHEKKRIEGERLLFVPVTNSTRAAAGLPDEVSFSSFTPKFGLEYKIDRDKLVYASVQKGFKSGSFAVGAITPAFRPETIWSYEIGFKGTWLGGALTTNLAAFHYDYSDLQQGVVSGPVVVVGNAANAKVDGVELELRARLGGGFSIDAAGGWLHARFSDYCTNDPARPAFNTLPADPGCTTGPRQLAGNLLSQAPRWSGNLGIEYATSAFGGELKARAEASGSSRVYFSAYNLENNSQAPYALFNAYLNWTSRDDHWTGGLFMRNIADRTVKGGSFVSTALVGSIINAALLPPRTYGLRVGYKF
jgi:iron complex outermembrane receptor protein